jgi:hypothetical protein
MTELDRRSGRSYRSKLAAAAKGIIVPDLVQISERWASFTGPYPIAVSPAHWNGNAWRPPLKIAHLIVVDCAPRRHDTDRGALS